MKSTTIPEPTNKLQGKIATRLGAIVTAAALASVGLAFMAGWRIGHTEKVGFALLCDDITVCMDRAETACSPRGYEVLESTHINKIHFVIASCTEQGDRE